MTERYGLSPRMIPLISLFEPRSAHMRIAYTQRLVWPCPCSATVSHQLAISKRKPEGGNARLVRMVFRSKSSGFTLIEVMLVVGVIGILAALAIPRYAAAKAAAGDATAKSDLRNAITALVRYSVTNGTYPATIAELEASGYSLSSRVSWDKYELKDGSVHMHVEHADSDNKWHAKYPEEGTEIEIR